MEKGKRSKNKKRKINNFTKTIFILIIIVISFMFAQNYIREDYINENRIMLNNEYIGDNLQNEYKIDSYGNVYMSFDDVKNTLDNNIFLEESTNSVITTGKTSIAVLKFNENKIRINDNYTQVLSPMYKENNIIYIPISELSNVYNIEINIINNNISINDLNNELIKYNARKNCDIKMKPTTFSGNADKVKKGEKIIFVSKDKNGWAKVCTQNGILGYIKEDFLTNKIVVREKMDYSDDTNLEGKNVSEVYLKDLQLDSFEKRESEVSKIIMSCIKNSINIVKLNYKETIDTKIDDRFYIELLPRLKEIGVNVIK